jgi:tRNA A-37 threonylcarbamoyl transferase component Bud32
MRVPFLPPAAQARPGQALSWQQIDLGRSIVRYDPAIFPAVSESLFEPDSWRQQALIVGESKGRHRVWFVRHGERELVLRHYYRGGLVGRLISDSYWRTSLNHCRSIAEFSLLQTLCNLSLPVPRPCAARVEWRGLCYKADILIERIPNSQDVARLLIEQRALTDQEWFLIGQTVRRLHDQGVYHADLNCHNLLLDTSGGCWVIDFDRCALRTDEGWKVDNLARLLRSLQKEQRLHPGFRWESSSWQVLLRGYRA